MCVNLKYRNKWGGILYISLTMSSDGCNTSTEKKMRQYRQDGLNNHYFPKVVRIITHFLAKLFSNTIFDRSDKSVLIAQHYLVFNTFVNTHFLPTYRPIDIYNSSKNNKHHYRTQWSSSEMWEPKKIMRVTHCHIFAINIAPHRSHTPKIV